jgi:hypothetical protein
MMSMMTVFRRSLGGSPKPCTAHKLCHFISRRAWLALNTLETRQARFSFRVTKTSFTTFLLADPFDACLEFP